MSALSDYLHRKIAEIENRTLEEHFVSRFNRSKKGNLYQNWEGWVLTIFKRKESQFSWCIDSDESGPRYATTQYETEEEAMESLTYEMLY